MFVKSLAVSSYSNNFIRCLGIHSITGQRFRLGNSYTVRY